MSGNHALDPHVAVIQERQFAVIIITSAESRHLRQLLRHLITELPHLKLSVLYEQPGRSASARAGTEPITTGFPVRPAVFGLARSLRAAGIACLDRVLRWFHAAPEYPNPKTPDLGELKRYAEANGVSFSFTEDFHAQTSLELVRRLKPDLGVFYRTRTPLETLTEIPGKGSINLDVCEYNDGRCECSSRRVAGKDGSSAQALSVRRLGTEASRGALLAERSLPIQEYDTPESLAVKADLLGIECLVDVIRAECSEGSGEQPAASPPPRRAPEQLRPASPEVEAVRRRRGQFRPAYRRPLIKLLARLLFYPRLWFSNRRRAAAGDFPLVILFGHVVADRPKFMGISTDQFLKQVRYLKKHYKIASLPEAVAMIEARSVPVPTVVLTFDDGYEDNYLGLRAVIDSEEVPVVLFVCTRNVEEHRPFDHDLKRGEEGFFPLTWDQLKTFERQGSTIGSHTRSHFDCGATEENVLREEIVGAREDLIRHLGHDVPYFSFPWGHPRNMSSPAVAIAAETYPYLFSAYGGINELRSLPAPVLKRTCLPERLLELEIALQGILDFRSDAGD